MEIEDIRKELNTLLNNVVDHSQKYSDERPIPSLEISFVLSKINKMQERLAVLKHLLEEKERGAMKNKKHVPEREKVELTPVDFDDDDDDDEEIETPAPKEEPKKQADIERLPIPLLVDALSLNDRYLYANELFEKDMNAFNEFVKSVDACSALEEAMNKVADLSWDEENEYVIAFLRLIERRFL